MRWTVMVALVLVLALFPNPVVAGAQALVSAFGSALTQMVGN